MQHRPTSAEQDSQISPRSKPTTAADDCDVLGHRLIKTFNRFVCKDLIGPRAKVDFEFAGIFPWKPKNFPHPKDYYARHSQNNFDTSNPSGFIWKTRKIVRPGPEKLIVSFKQDMMQTAASIARVGQTKTSDKTEFTLE